MSDSIYKMHHSSPIHIPTMVIHGIPEEDSFLPKTPNVSPFPVNSPANSYFYFQSSILSPNVFAQNLSPNCSYKEFHCKSNLSILSNYSYSPVMNSFLNNGFMVLPFGNNLQLVEWFRERKCNPKVRSVSTNATYENITDNFIETPDDVFDIPMNNKISVAKKLRNNSLDSVLSLLDKHELLAKNISVDD